MNGTRIQGISVVSGATRLKCESVELRLFKVNPPTEPIDTKEERRMELSAGVEEYSLFKSFRYMSLSSGQFSNQNFHLDVERRNQLKYLSCEIKLCVSRLW